MNKMWIQHRYNVEKHNMDELNFPWKKMLCVFRMIYNFTVALNRIDFTICKVQKDNWNPENRQKY